MIIETKGRNPFSNQVNSLKGITSAPYRLPWMAVVIPSQIRSIHSHITSSNLQVESQVVIPSQIRSIHSKSNPTRPDSGSSVVIPSQIRSIHSRRVLYSIRTQN